MSIFSLQCTSWRIVFAVFICTSCFLNTLYLHTNSHLMHLESNTMENKEHYQVLGIGSALIDNLIYVEDIFIEERGGGKGGCQVVDWPTFQGILKDSPTPPHQTSGGSCSNSIKGLSKLGVKTRLICPVGKDHEAQFFKKELDDYEVNAQFVYSTESTSQLACVITPDKQRTFRVFLGASAHFCDDDLNPELFKNVQLVHMDGYAFRNRGLVQRAMELAKQNNAFFSLDLGCFEIVRDYKEEIETLVKSYVEVLFANEDEAKALVNKAPFEAAQILSSWCKYAVILCGKEGCWVGYQGKSTHYPVREVEVIDTCGAGDLFASGFLYGFLKGKDHATCAELGNFLGSTVIQCKGAQISTEKWNQVLSHNRLLSKLAF